MTEAEWLTSDQPASMLDAISHSADLRNGRLFALACCRRVEHLLTAEEKYCQQAITTLERHIERAVDDRELAERTGHVIGDVYDAAAGIGHPGDVGAYAVRYAALVVASGLERKLSVMSTAVSAAVAYETIARQASRVVEEIASRWGRDRFPTRLSEIDWNRDEAAVIQMAEFRSIVRIEEHKQADQLRDIFGNPFRPVVFDPRWRTETTVALAAGIDAERAFDRLPILADALEDAGCDHADILHHCRGPGPHVRGCWVVELVLGKE